MTETNPVEYDVLVVGAGAAGMESALTLGDMGYRVLLVEKEASVGGKMILLSKVFPTLDCASCISTPKMASTGHHPMVDTSVFTEVESIERLEDGRFRVQVVKKPTYVDFDRCTGCQSCEHACSVAVPDHFNFEMVSRRAAYIAFPQAVPKKAVIQRLGRSPCNAECPAGIRAHGYVSLARSGDYQKAMELILKDSPLVATLGRACYAPCELRCSRGMLEGPVAIRRIKRFIADWYYKRHPEPEPVSMPPSTGKSVAVVGSGPAGLTAAYHLARSGHKVTIFEAASEPGGMLRSAIPTYRLPRDCLDRDIKNVIAWGVEIKTGTEVVSLPALKAEGFDAVFLSLGTIVSRRMMVEGEDLVGVSGAMSFLSTVHEGARLDLSGKNVLIIGGGNVAIDSARVARRLGAAKVTLEYRRSREEMPAHNEELRGASEEGIDVQYLRLPVRFNGRSGNLTEVESVDMMLGDTDRGGRPRPMPIEGSSVSRSRDLAIIAIGLQPASEVFSELARNKDGTIKVDPETMETSLSGVFAGGDCVTGPSMITTAAGQGKRAAFHIDRMLRGFDLKETAYAIHLETVESQEVLARQETHRRRPPLPVEELPVEDRLKGGNEVERPMTEAQALGEAARCLDCGTCSECQQCVEACPAYAISLGMERRSETVEVGSVVLSTGYKLIDASRLGPYGYGKYANVITAMQMDRLLAPTRPYNTVLRPSDGKVPENIAFVFCAGSRDRTADNRLCSRVCCMYSIKQAQLIMGALPLADITAYYIDIRAFGKGYEEFFREAEAMGVNFVKGKVADIFEDTKTQNLRLTYENIAEGRVVTTEHDLVVLSVGLIPNDAPLRLFRGQELQADEFGYVKEIQPDLDPGRTSVEGVFVAGAASAAMDIPDTIVHSGATAVQAAAYIERLKRGSEQKGSSS